MSIVFQYDEDFFEKKNLLKYDENDQKMQKIYIGNWEKKKLEQFLFGRSNGSELTICHNFYVPCFSSKNVYVVIKMSRYWIEL